MCQAISKKGYQALATLYAFIITLEILIAIEKNTRIRKRVLDKLVYTYIIALIPLLSIEKKHLKLVRKRCSLGIALQKGVRIYYNITIILVKTKKAVHAVVWHERLSTFSVLNIKSLTT